MMAEQDREAWITGIGIISALGQGPHAHYRGLIEQKVHTDKIQVAPYVIHPLAEIDFAKQIPKGELRLMGTWQRIGTYAAGLALDDAGVKGRPEILSRVDMVVSAGSGERDLECDCAVLADLRATDNPGRLLNERLLRDLRPTLFLGQLPNLLAGNISIVHGVTGSSRTFLGEESGIEALRVAHARIASGQSEIALVGGAHNAARRDLLLFYEAGGCALKGEFAPVLERDARGGGVILGSLGAFLVIEARSHAQARDAAPRARLTEVLSERRPRQPSSVTNALERMWDKLAPCAAQGAVAVLSGASGAEPATTEERVFVSSLGEIPVHATGNGIGYGAETQFSMNVALAAVMLSQGAADSVPAPPKVEPMRVAGADRIIVTGVGHRRGEGMALVESVDRRRRA
jgi:3-oxoacyl-[acyl-carrier-protein] synthase II